MRTLTSYYIVNPLANQVDYTVFESLATSFLLTCGVENQSYHQFVKRFRELKYQKYDRERVPAKHCQKNLWLVKPANENQGRGIELFSDLKEIKKFLASKKENSYFVVQKYIEKPLLYLGRKFDIRVWALVTPNEELFVYKYSYMRTSSYTYSTENQDNLYIHLTNNCL